MLNKLLKTTALHKMIGKYFTTPVSPKNILT